MTSQDLECHGTFQLCAGAISRIRFIFLFLINPYPKPDNYYFHRCRAAPHATEAPFPMYRFKGAEAYAGADSGARTRNPRLGRPMLCQLSYIRI